MSNNPLLMDMVAWASAQAPAAETHRYGADPDQIADLLLPTGAGPHPVAVLLHGGYWRPEYSYVLMDALAVGLAARGWASWNVEYRRQAPDGRVSRAALSDVRAALMAVTDVPAPVDLDRLVVVGHSAGGHLALCTAGTVPTRLVVSLAGVGDLIAAAEHPFSAGAVAAFIGASPSEDPAGYAEANPIAALPTGVRTLLVHGHADDRVPLSQGRIYQAAARQAGDSCDLLELPGEDHFSVIDPRSGAFAAWADRLPT